MSELGFENSNKWVTIFEISLPVHKTLITGYWLLTSGNFVKIFCSTYMVTVGDVWKLFQTAIKSFIGL